MGWNQLGEWEPHTLVHATPAQVAAMKATAEAKAEAKRQAVIEERRSVKTKEADAKMKATKKLERAKNAAEEAAEQAKHQKGVQEFYEKTDYNKHNTKDNKDGYYTRKEQREAQHTIGNDKTISMADVERARNKLNGTVSSQLECMRAALEKVDLGAHGGLEALGARSTDHDRGLRSAWLEEEPPRRAPRRRPAFLDH